jgi:hypothetical protein
MTRRKAGELVTRAVAVAAIMKITGLTYGAVQQHIVRAVTAGDLRRAKLSPDRFEALALGTWARRKWPRHFFAIIAHWPFEMRIIGGHAQIHQPPGTLAACQALIAEQTDRIEQLEQELAEVRRARLHRTRRW